MSWRDEPITDKQLAYISFIQEFSEWPLPLFDGKTKGQAADWINENSWKAYERIVSEHEDAGDRV